MRVLRDNGLTIALMIAFLFSLTGMVFAGRLEHNEQLMQHGQAGLSVLQYFMSSDFQSALFENWESEFLQMATYVVLTAMLFQRGSAESKDPDDDNPEDEDPASKCHESDTPGPIKAGGLLALIYSYSLGLALGTLFILSFLLHWLNSTAAANDEALQHGQPTQSALEYLFSAQLWFESFQNWQSEFLSTAVLVVLSIFLRFRGSAESKPVAAPHRQTGS